MSNPGTQEIGSPFRQDIHPHPFGNVAHVSRLAGSRGPVEAQRETAGGQGDNPVGQILQIHVGAYKGRVVLRDRSTFRCAHAVAQFLLLCDVAPDVLSVSVYHGRLACGHCQLPGRHFPVVRQIHGKSARFGLRNLLLAKNTCEHAPPRPDGHVAKLDRVHYPVDEKRLKHPVVVNGVTRPDDRHRILFEDPIKPMFLHSVEVLHFVEEDHCATFVSEGFECKVQRFRARNGKP